MALKAVWGTSPGTEHTSAVTVARTGGDFADWNIPCLGSGIYQQLHTVTPLGTFSLS